MEFRGTNVLITGASRGIGAKTAEILAKFRLKIWINFCEKEDKALEVKKSIIHKYPNAGIELIQFDVSNEESYINAINHIIAKDGKLDYLVNNAGITKDSLSIIMDISDYDTVMNINAKSCFIGSREALKNMGKNRFGAVVNISSIAAEIGNIGQSNYASSKGAIISMTKSFAREGAHRNIRFNVVTPGLILTDMTEILSDSIKNDFFTKIPLKKFGNTEDVAYAVSFLLSDYSQYTTGEVLKVNGGLYM